MTRHWRLVVRRDGRDALVFQDEPTPWSTQGNLEVLATVALRESRNVGVAGFLVLVTQATLRQLGSGLLLPSGSQVEELELLVECALGDHLDALEEPLPDEGTLPINVVCQPDYLHELARRERCTEEAARLYLAAKTWWADRLNRLPVVIHRADALRLAFPMTGLLRLARMHEDEYWTFVGDAQPDVFMLRPSRELMKAGPRMRGYVTSGQVFDVLDRLADRRYQASAAQLRKAYAFLTVDRPDYENAAKDAIGAVESLARRLSGESTLGRAAEALKRRGFIDAPTAKILTDIYDYRSRTPGVGHGGETPPASEVSEARLIVNLCASILMFLVELDR